MLALFVLFVVGTAGVALALSLVGIDALATQARDALWSTLDLNLKRIEETRDRIDLAELSLELDKALIRRVAQAPAPSAEDLESLQTELGDLQQKLGWSPNNQLYVYFGANGTAVGSSPQSTRTGLERGIFEDLEALPSGMDAFARTRFAHDAQGNPYSVRSELFGDDVYLVYVIWGAPNSKSQNALLAEAPTYEMYFYDRYGTAVAVAGSEQHLADLYTYESLGEKPRGSFAFNYQGRPYICFYETVQDSDSRFALFAVDTAAEARNAVMGAVLLVAGATVAAGVALAFFAARRLYAPVQAIVDHLPQPKEGGIRDDYGLIDEVLRQQDEALEAQKELVRHGHLLRRLHGEPGRLKREEGSGGFGFFFDENPTRFAVVLMRIDARQDGAPAGVPDGDRLAELARACGCPCLTVWDGDELCAVFDLQSRDAVGLGTVLETLRRTCEERAGLLLSLFAGSIHTDGRDLGAAYAEARQAELYCAALERYNTVQGYEAIRVRARAAAQASVPDADTMRRLCEAVEGLAFEEAMALFDEVAGDIVRRKDLSLCQAKTVLALVKAQVAQAVLSIDAVLVADPAVLTDCADRIMEAEGLSHVRAALEPVLRSLYEEGSRVHTDAARFDEIRTFVDGHFTDPNLSSGAVAERFGLCPSSVTRLFKKYAGTGFLEYVHELRVGQAKKLLRSTGLSVAEVAERVGYTNPLTLTRAFKRYAGTTPGAFRRG